MLNDIWAHNVVKQCYNKKRYIWTSIDFTIYFTLIYIYTLIYVKNKNKNNINKNNIYTVLN